MKVIICGAGQVGFNIAQYLSSTNNDLTLIDLNAELISRLSDSLDIQGICGSGTHPQILAQAGAQDADMLIAVTQSDEVNMVACEVAHALFNVPTKIARIRNQEYLNPEWLHLFQEQNVSIDVIISPELEVARAISRSLKVPGAFEIMPFAGGAIQVVGVRCPTDCHLINTPLRHIPSLFPDLEMTIVGVCRGNTSFLPAESDSLLPQDEVYFVVPRDQVEAAMRAFSLNEQESETILIMGGGNIGLCLAQEIEAYHPNATIKIIEKNKQRAELIAQQLSRSIVLWGDAFDHELLAEATVSSCDRIIAVTEDDKVNALASLLAKSRGAKRALCLINNPNYVNLVTSLGVDAVISPRNITASRILQHVHKGRVRSIYPLKEGFGEILEAIVSPASTFVGQTVKTMNLNNHIIVAAIMRDQEIIIPNPATIIRSEDRIIVTATREAMRKVETLLALRSDY